MIFFFLSGMCLWTHINTWGWTRQNIAWCFGFFTKWSCCIISKTRSSLMATGGRAEVSALALTRKLLWGWLSTVRPVLLWQLCIRAIGCVKDQDVLCCYVQTFALGMLARLQQSTRKLCNSNLKVRLQCPVGRSLRTCKGGSRAHVFARELCGWSSTRTYCTSSLCRVNTLFKGVQPVIKV